MDGAVATETKAGLLRFTVEQVSAMCDAGVFGGVDRLVELREGLLYQMSPLWVPHSLATSIVFMGLHEALARLGSSLRAFLGASVRVDARNLPIPDILVWDPVRTRTFVPVERVRLAVEICGTTHDDDLGWKPGLYAAGGIPEYWIVDLPGRIVHQRWAPAQGAYGQERTIRFGEAVTAATLPGVSVDTTPLGDVDTAE